MLYIQSITISGRRFYYSCSLFCKISSCAFYLEKRQSKASTLEFGKIEATKFDTTYAFEIPTSALVANACRLREDRVTRSKSITRIR